MKCHITMCKGDIYYIKGDICCHHPFYKSMRFSLDPASYFRSILYSLVVFIGYCPIFSIVMSQFYFYCILCQYSWSRVGICLRQVKYLESACARVVPLHYDAPLDTLTDLFGKINGILFPGGGADLRDLDGTYVSFCPLVMSQ